MLFVSLALGLPGCVVEPVDLSGKGCPCAPGFRCDEGADRCVRDGAECDALVTVEGFRAAWATANVIRWEWEPAGDREDFVRYEIEIAERVEDLGTERARVVDADENPELGSFVLPRTGGADDVVTHSATFAHAAEATHVAQLLVTDRAFCTFRSAMAGISTTLDPPEEIVLFRDARPDPGFAVPSQLSVVDDGSGNFVTEHVPSRDAECVASGEGVCSQNLRLASPPTRPTSPRASWRTSRCSRSR